MNENEMNNNEMQVAPVQEQVTVQQAADPVISEKKGMSTGQKLAGAGLIAFAIAGIVWAVKSIIGGVKKVVKAFKKEEPVQQAAPAPVVQEPAAPQVQQEVQQAAPEQK